MTVDWIKEIPNWEKEYLTMDVQLNERQKEILNGDAIKSHEGMLFGGMYADWKKRKGYDVEENVKSVNTSDETSELYVHNLRSTHRIVGRRECRS